MNTGDVGQSPTRYLEVDFLRGCAILVIFWNHLLYLVQESGDLVYSHVRIHYGFSDLATVFVFISGFVSGLVYEKRLRETNFLQCQLKALKRAGQVYFANLATLVVFLVLSVAVPFLGIVGPLGYHFHFFTTGGMEQIMGFLTLQSGPCYVDILPFYVIVLPFAPLMVAGIRAHAGWTLAVSFLLYAAVQVMDAGGIPIPLSTMFINPLAWQFLFLLGIFFGVGTRGGKVRLKKSRVWALIAAVIVVYSFLDSKGVQTTLHLSGWAQPLANAVLVPLPWTDKVYLEPLVLLHFGATAYLGWMLLPQLGRILHHRFLRPLLACGRNSLRVFCISIVLDYLFCALVLRAGGTTLSFVSVGIGGWCLLLWVSPYVRQSPLRASRVLAGEIAKSFLAKW